MLEDPKFWVAVSFFIFVGLAYKKIVAFVCRSLDDRGARIRHELDEARRLREEAEAVLAQYQQKHAEATREAEALIASAQKDAQTLRAHAEKELASQLEARTQQAMERIAQEETQAVADVREHVVDIALAAARAIITDHVGKLPQDELVKLAVSDIERKIH